MECLDDNVASEFVSGALPKTAVTKVENHLAKCRDCRDLVAALAMDCPDDSQAATRPHEKDTAYADTAHPNGQEGRKWTVGDRVGRYLVLSALGAGGMGVVFSAYDPQLDRKVALKLLRSAAGINTKDARARLRREAQAIAQLSHPNVVNVYDVGATDDGDVYIAMEFVEGDTLTHWLRKFSRTPREIIDVFLQAARGLYAAHSVSLLHRDFKPDNVLVGGDGRVRVTDFGLARSVLGPDDAPKPKIETTHLHVELTATGTVLGTPRYMPPEQLLGPNIDARSDQFSFCVALYEALFGQHPLPGATSVQMLETDARAIPPPEKKGLPSNIGRAIARGLEKDRAKRWPTMAALITELSPRIERSPVRFAALSLGAVVIAGAAAAAVYASRDPKQPEEQLSQQDETIAILLVKLEESEKARRELATQVTEILKRAGKSTEELERVQSELSQKNNEIEELVTQLAALKTGVPQVATNPKFTKPMPTKVAPVGDQGTLVLTRFAAVEFAGCFSEWSERPNLTTGKSNARDVDVSIKLTVLPEGKGVDPEANPGGDVGPSLAFCVEAASTRVAYPRGPEVLEIKALIRYVHEDRRIDVIPTIVARRMASVGEQIDLKK